MSEVGRGGPEGEARFRQVMGHFATGVAVVTGVDREGAPLGFTANAVSSVSLEPLLVLVAVDRGSASLPALLERGAFGISFLPASDEELARRFADRERNARFDGVSLRMGTTGVPLLAEALAWLDCSLWRTVEAGDHLVLFGEVLECGVERDDEPPLVFYQGRYGTVAP
jgi:flavin reductase (DIM6/NTAB) family NADH-FMN oxidoreductase RutF